MAAVKDSLEDIEKHRLQLEENIARLRRALQHWRQWDAEYEELKEEIESVAQPASQKDLARIRRDYAGELIDRKEISDLFGRIDLKPTDQIVNLLSRRIDYVTRNIETLEKQVEEAEAKYAEIAALSAPDATGEEGLPITEIVEELDDNDNVLSYQLRKPGESQPQLREILEKAGVKNLTEPVDESQPVPSAAEEAVQLPSTIVPSQAQAPEPVAKDETDGGSLASARRGVSFAEDTKPGHEPEKSRAAKRVERVMQTAKEQEESSREGAVVPSDESEEDAKLRREMLRYGMGEVGAVVAELTLEEGTDDDDDWEFDYSDDEDEDEFGRSKTVLDDDYHQRMLELEQRLGVKSRFTQKLEKEEEDSDKLEEGIGRIKVKNDDRSSSDAAAADTTSALKSSNPRSVAATDAAKSVRFADTLDVSPDAPTPIPALAPAAPRIDPVSDVVERTGQPKRTEQKPTRKPTSRFRRQLAEPAILDEVAPTAPPTTTPKGPLDVPLRFLNQDRPTAPSGPEGQTLAAAIVERTAIPPPQDSEELDDEFVDQEVAEEYYRRRKTFIQREGGFMKEDESPIQPLDEEDGGPKRMSRFMAARLSKQ